MYFIVVRFVTNSVKYSPDYTAVKNKSCKFFKPHNCSYRLWCFHIFKDQRKSVKYIWIKIYDKYITEDFKIAVVYTSLSLIPKWLSFIKEIVKYDFITKQLRWKVLEDITVFHRLKRHCVFLSHYIM